MPTIKRKWLPEPFAAAAGKQISVLLSASVERFGVSRMQDFWHTCWFFSEKIFMISLEGCRKIFVGCRVALKSTGIYTKNYIYWKHFISFNLRSKTAPIGSKAGNFDILCEFFSLKNFFKKIAFWEISSLNSLIWAWPSKLAHCTVPPPPGLSSNY